MSFTVGSLFDGSGGFPLAAFLCGGIPVWASEIEPYPIAVTKSRFPHMKHLGCVTDINAAEYKLWGNGIALPTTLYVMQGIAEVFNKK